MPYFVELQVPGSASREHELPQAAVVVGSAADAEIRVPEGTGLAARHLELVPAAEGVRVTLAAGVRLPLIFRGQKCSEALVPWGEEAYAGSVRLAFIVRHKRAGSPLSLLLLLAPVVLLAAGMLALPKLTPALEEQPPLEAPSLALERIECRETEQARAEHRAREAEHAGHAKLQRFAFVAREGVEALDLLSESAACYRAAGRNAEAERLQAASADWSRRLNQDYAAARLRLRLRVALGQERHREALSAVRHLEALLSARPPSAYAEWLSSLGRRLERRLGGSRS